MRRRPFLLTNIKEVFTVASKRRREVEVTILDQKFIMAFDMTSVDLFKEIHKDSFIKASASIGEFDDKTLLDFAAATIRRPDSVDTPLGTKLFDIFDPMDILLACSNQIVQLVFQSLPKAEDGKTQKK